MAGSLKLERKQRGNAHTESRVLCRRRAQVRVPGEPSHGQDSPAAKLCSVKRSRYKGETKPSGKATQPRDRVWGGWLSGTMGVRKH